MEIFKSFNENFLNYLIENHNAKINISKLAKLTRKNKSNLLKQGDITLPLDEKVLRSHNIEIDEDFRKKLKEIVEMSESWTININQVDFVNKNNISVCNLYINRPWFFKNYIKQFNEESYGTLTLQDSPKFIYNFCIEIESMDLEKLSITQYRIVLLRNIIQNLLKFVRYESNQEYPSRTVLVTQKTSLEHDNDVTIRCGCVYDPRDGKKMAKITASEYINQRSIDMQLMAQHKYGLRVRNESVFIDLINKLGSAAAIVDLIETKHTSPVGIVMGNRQSSSKGASFILYNSARLEAIIRIFEERVAKGYYPPLPSSENIDFTLLKEKEEWEMFYSFISEFPSLIQRSIGNLDRGDISIHAICLHLNHLVGLFSVYYRRVKILTENREQLLPVMYARLTLLYCLRNTFNKILKVLSIEPVTQM